MSRRAERIGTPQYYEVFNGRFPNPDYLLATSANRERIEQEIEKDFGELPEVNPPNHNYFDESSPNFVDFGVIAYNRELGHVLFRGSSSEKLHFTEYFLEDRARKAFSRRGLIFPSSKPNAFVSEAEITFVDGGF